MPHNIRLQNSTETNVPKFHGVGADTYLLTKRISSSVHKYNVKNILFTLLLLIHTAIEIKLHFVIGPLITRIDQIPLQLDLVLKLQGIHTNVFKSKV